MTALFSTDGLVKHYPYRRNLLGTVTEKVHAVNGVSLTVHEQETVGIVGESGCGKSTFGKAALRLIEPTAGRLTFGGEDFSGASGGDLKAFRQKAQYIFQDPYSSLNPRFKVGDILAEPYLIHGLHQRSDPALAEKLQELVDTVALPAGALNKYPHEFSGGQRQRIGIARAIALKPQLIIADEPVSALDVSVQSQILNLLQKLKKQFNLAMMFITHDLSVVYHVSDQVVVMYMGCVVEQAPTAKLFAAPRHPYTKALLASVPHMETQRTSKRFPSVLEGDVPSPINLPSGCSFHPRCPLKTPQCVAEAPTLRVGEGDDGNKSGEGDEGEKSGEGGDSRAQAESSRSHISHKVACHHVA